MAVFSDAQIQEILRITMQSLGTHQYIGARYVPIFGRKGENTWQWNNTAPYEPLTVVQYQGVSYTSRQYVPAGLGTPDQHGEFWAETGNYNAQIEAYRQEVLRFDDRITANSDAIADFNTELGMFENTVTANNWVTTNRIADNAITSSKIANGAITSSKIADGSINSSKIANGSIKSEDIADGVITRGYLAVVGDSFSDETSEWPTLVKNKMGYTGLINKAVAGSGFIRSGFKNFVTQFNELLTDANFDKVTDIVIYGGVNDYVHTSQSVSDYVSAFESIYNAYTALPAKTRPRLIMVFGNCHSIPEKSALNGYAAFCDEINVRLQRIGFTIVDGAKYWLLFELENVDSGDNIHPNTLGKQIIAGYMLQVLDGTYSGVVKRHKIRDLENIGSGSGFIDTEFNNGIISYYAAIQASIIENVTTQFTRLYNNDNLHTEIGAVASYTGAPNMLYATEPRYNVIWQGTSAIYLAYVTFAYSFTSKTFGIFIGGSGSDANRLAVLRNVERLNESNQLTLTNAFFRAAGN